MLTHVSHLLVVILTSVSLGSLHCQMKFLCLGLFCKVEAYMMALCKHSKSTLNQLKTNIFSWACCKQWHFKTRLLTSAGNVWKNMLVAVYMNGVYSSCSHSNLARCVQGKIRKGLKERKKGKVFYSRRMRTSTGTPTKTIVTKGN